MTSQSNPRPQKETPIPAEVWIPADPASSGRRRRSFSIVNLVLAGILALIVALMLGFAVILAGLYVTSDMIFPGVKVMGVDVGSMTRTEAAAVLQERWLEQQIVLMHEDRSWPVGITDLGLTLDAEATAEQAYAQGRSLDSLIMMVQGGRQGQALWAFEPTAAASTLAVVAPELAIPPTNAAVKIEQGRVVESPAADGRALDVERTMAYLADAPAQVLETGRLPLVTRPVPAAVTDVTDMVTEARRLLSTSVTLHAYDPVVDETVEWIIPPQSWTSWLSLSGDVEGEEPFAWVVDQGAAELFLATQLQGLGEDRYLDHATLIPMLKTAISTQEPVVRTRIFHHPRQHVVQSGETLSAIGRAYGIPYPWIQQANPGTEFLQAGSTITIPSADEMLPLPVVENKRIVINLSRQRVWVYEDGQIKWEWPASTGIDDSPTAPGVFQIQTHEQNAYASNWDLWMPSFMGIYRPLPTADFMNGFHGFPTRSGSTLLWTGDLGHQVTYGCILLSSENASLLYDWAEEGVVVEIQP